MTTIFISGALANKPLNGGEAWVRLSWILGFQQLGCDVVFVEQIDSASCRASVTGVPVPGEADVSDPVEASLNLSYFREVTAQFGLGRAAALIDVDSERIYGMERADLLARAEDASLLVNISGHLTWKPLLRRLRRKAYLDIDPGYTQFWHADRTVPFEVSGHDFYFTIAENIGLPVCAIPIGGIDWQPVRQPVVLDQWPVSTNGRAEHSTAGAERFTTVASWRGAFGPVQDPTSERVYGVKAHAFRRFVELPQRAPQRFEIALSIHPGDDKDRTLLQEHGWQLVDPLVVAAGPHAFRDYVQNSAAEFSAAQAVYTETNCGWFSDRTTRYLASGRPALVQETGFSRWLPTGEGLLSFRTLQEAVDGATRIEREYEAHCQAARALAERYFDARRVLGRFLEETGIRI